MTKQQQGQQPIIPTLVVDGAAEAISLYTKAFGAKEEYRMPRPDGKIMHACISLNGSKVFLCDADPQMCAPSTSYFYLYVDDVDAAYKTAKAANLEALGSGPEDMFWGDRIGGLKDKFGNRWTLATHQRDLSPAEIEKGQKEFIAKMAKKAA